MRLTTYRQTLIFGHLRSEGAAFSSHVREGVEQLLKAMSAEAAELIWIEKKCRPIRPQGFCTAFHASRTWLLNTGPLGLRIGSE